MVMLAAMNALAGVPTFQDLMDPAVFPDAQFGMQVDSASANADSAKIVTTGAIIELDAARGVITFQQRIGHERPVATLHLPGPLRGITLTHKGPGFARLTIEQPKATVRINGDSLLFLQMHEPLTTRVERQITPAWHASWMANHLIVDELGGFSLYCSEPETNDQFSPAGRTVATYALPSNAVLCVGVCPPKPYAWDRSFKDQVVWHWSSTLAYPPDKDLREWKAHGNLVLLQSETMLWKDWNLDFVPRLGTNEYLRVKNTLHDMGMRFIVYTSPYYFLKGTSQESRAINDKAGQDPGAITDGENMPLFLDAIRRVMRDLKPDGLFFDGQYHMNPAALYALARHGRAIIGDKGILEWHSTFELGPMGSLMYMPHADAYTDMVGRGEGKDRLYSNFNYMRYFVSGYNIHNSIGVLYNNGGNALTLPQLELLLQTNGRLHTLLCDLDFTASKYRPRLNPELRTMVERGCEERQQKAKGVK